MTKPDDRRGMLSRLPDEPEYWARLTDRVMEDVAPSLAARRGVGGAWWRPMARHAGVLAAGAAAAVVAALTLLAAEPPSEGREGAVDIYSLAPPDPIVTPLVLATEAPALSTLFAPRDPELRP
jgi:hypothetical protein